MNEELLTLIDKYLNGDATERERGIVDAWYLSFDANPGLTDTSSPDELAKAMVKNFAALLGALDSPAKNLQTGSC